MKKLISKFVSLALAAGLLLSLAACSGGAGTTAGTGAAKPDATTAAGAEAGKKTVVVWTNDRHDLEYVNQKIDEYNQSNKDGIFIDYKVMTDDYVNMIQTAAAANKAPDVFGVTATLSGFNLQSFVNAGIAQPIGDKLSDTFKQVNDFDKVKFQGINVIGDEVYWVPTAMRSGGRFIYNEEIFKSAGVTPPKTLADAVTLAKTITDKGAGKFYGVIFPGQSAPFERWLEGSAQMSGILPYDYKTGKFSFDGYKPFLEVARKFFLENTVFPGSATMPIDPTRAQFAEGTVGFMGNASQEVGVLTQQFPAKQPWGVAELPTLNGEVKGALSVNAQRGWMVSKTADIDAAMKVIEFLGTEDYLKGYLEKGYALPISTYMEGKIDKTKTGRLADFALQPYESVYPLFPQVSVQGDPYRVALWNAIVTPEDTVDATIASLNERYNAALDKDVKMGKVKRLVIKDFDPLKPNAGTLEYLDQ